MNNRETITIYSELHPQSSAAGYRSDDSRLEQSRSPSNSARIEKVKKSISDFSDAVSEILSSLPTNESGFSVDQIEAHAFIDYEGGIQLIGAKFGASVQGGLKFVWRRAKK